MVWTMMDLNWRAEGMVFVCSDVRRGTKSSALGAASHRVCRESHLNSLAILLFCQKNIYEKLLSCHCAKLTAPEA